MADPRLPIPLGDNAFERSVYAFLTKGHDEDGDPSLGTSRSLATDKTLRAGRSLVVRGFYRIEDGVTLTIEADAELAIL